MTGIETERLHYLNRKLRFYLLVSVGIHLAIIVMFIFFPKIFVSKPKDLISSVQIDLVALPQYTKGNEPTPDVSLPISKDAPKTTPPANDETKTKSDLSFKQEQEKKKKTNTKSLLDKIRQEVKKNKRKNLAKNKRRKREIEQKQKELAEFDKKVRQAISGNQTATGNSAVGEISDSVRDAYGGHIRDALRENWSLPAFLQNSNLRAEVIIFIDQNGRTINYRFTHKSGNSLFDDFVRSAVENSKFAPPPLTMARSLRNEGVGVKFPL